MALDPNRWTLKTQEAVNAALAAARAASNPEVTPDHLLAALLGQEEGVVLPILAEGRRGARCTLRNAAEEALAKLPKAYGGEARIGRELTARARRGPTRPARELARRVPLDRAPAAGPGRHGSASTRERAARPRSPQVRGSHRVTSQNPEEQYQALEKYGRDLTEAARAGQDRPGHRPRRGDPPRHPGAVAAAPRTTRCSSASPASARPPSSRASPGASSRATCPRACKQQAAHLARPRLDGRRRQVPRRVRGAAQGRAQGDHRRRGRGHHLHRRDAHRRRRRRGRGRDGRRQHAQADARPRRAAHDRRHHPRRVPQAHREGRRPRAPLPAGLRRPAVGRGHDRHPPRPQGALRGAPRRAHPGRRPRRRGRALRPLPHRPLPARQGHRPRRRGRRPSCASRSTRCRPRSTSSSAASASSRSSGWRWPRRPTRRRQERLAALDEELANLQRADRGR